MPWSSGVVDPITIQQQQQEQHSHNNNAQTAYHDHDEEESDPHHVQGKGSALNWRLDPIESLSDWKIEIVVRGATTTGTTTTTKTKTTKTSNVERAETTHMVNQHEHDDDENQEPVSIETVKTYHVHKCILAVGPKKSEYFLRLFQGKDRYVEYENSTSRIILEPIAADAFPTMLDYMYNTNDVLDICTENATSLQYLGQYFEMKSLRREVNRFWSFDLTMETIDIYYDHARILHDDKIMTNIIDLCSTQILKINEDSKIITLADANFWLDVIQVKPGHNSRYKSILITKFCSSYYTSSSRSKDEADINILRKLTDEVYIPQIDFKAARQLIELEQKIMKSSKGGCDPSAISIVNDNVITSATTQQEPTTSLQIRCIRSMAENWVDLDIENNTDMMEFLRQQSPTLLTMLLSLSITSSKQDFDVAVRELDATMGDLQTMSREIRESQQALQETRRQLDELKLNHNGCNGINRHQHQYRLQQQQHLQQASPQPQQQQQQQQQQAMQRARVRENQQQQQPQYHGRRPRIQQQQQQQVSNRQEDNQQRRRSEPAARENSQRGLLPRRRLLGATGNGRG